MDGAADCTRTNCDSGYGPAPSALIWHVWGGFQPRAGRGLRQARRNSGGRISKAARERPRSCAGLEAGSGN